MCVSDLEEVRCEWEALTGQRLVGSTGLGHDWFERGASRRVGRLEAREGEWWKAKGVSPSS